MAQVAVRPSARATAKIKERETRLVHEAIAMVAMGGSPRVIVAGIRHGEELLGDARRHALTSGVRVNTIRRSEDGGTDLVVEPIYE